VKKGLITEKEIDEALRVLTRTRVRLGLFDPPGSGPYDQLKPEVINSAEHRALARQVATKSIVMLKNNGVLPLRKDLPYYYVMGPNAGNVDALLGNYYGINNNIVTVLEGVSGAIEPGSQLQYKMGFLLDGPNTNPIDWTTGDAKSADACIVVMGISGLLEGEEGESILAKHYGDRLDYNIPGSQIEFLKKVRRGSDKPLIAVITGGSPMNLTEVHELADAVLMVWYPGEEGGNAVADIIFGNASPSGKLPLTFPKSLDQLPPYEDYSMAGRTYRYMEAEPMYPFGFGLTYGKIEYSGLTAAVAKTKKGEPHKVDVTVTVSNRGDRTVQEVVQLYITDMKASVKVPLYSLKDFKRIELAAGESKQVSFTLNTSHLMLVNDKGEKVFEPGEFKVWVGGSSPGKRSTDLGASPVVRSQFMVK
jgi:beta-glucosidase